MRIDLVRPDDRPYAFLQLERYGSRQPSWSLDVRRYIPVDAVVAPVADVEVRRAAATALIADVTAQFGISPSDFNYTW